MTHKDKEEHLALRTETVGYIFKSHHEQQDRKSGNLQGHVEHQGNTVKSFSLIPTSSHPLLYLPGWHLADLLLLLAGDALGRGHLLHRGWSGAALWDALHWLTALRLLN